MLHYPVVFLESCREDENIVHIHHHNTFINQTLEDLIHHCLEGGRTVSETKEHDSRLKESSICTEGRFPLITILDPDVVISPPYIQFGEELCFGYLGNEVRDQWEWVCILDGESIQFPIALNEPK